MRPVEGPQDTHLLVEGRRALSLFSTNYLRLATHPALTEAAARVARDIGVGAGASHLISGSMRIHHDLEERLAAQQTSVVSFDCDAESFLTVSFNR